MCKRTFHRATWALLLATGPLGMACQLALDFDRSPLQPEYEASIPDARGDTSLDGSPDGSSNAAQDAVSDASPISDAADSGTDAEGG